MKLKIAPSNFIELVKKQYSLDNIYMLKMIDEGIDLEEVCKESARFNSLYTSLERKGLVSGGKVTMIGKELIVFTESESADKIVKRKPATSEFAMWWAAYPGTDTFEHKGRKFIGSRSLRQNKDECRLKFDKILIEGEYSVGELIAALEYDVLMKKENSVKTGNNKLSYMQNSLTYLNQRSFESFIELIRAGKAEKEEKQIGNAIDI
ncbi:MAG TPA: hypothetical protein PLW74_01615 [Candidatus Dojkabacteria bacterium]|mgnify:FL=1|nr:hypothetical protein [Candidatus Dojkabacteria bacterium]